MLSNLVLVYDKHCHASLKKKIYFDRWIYFGESYLQNKKCKEMMGNGVDYKTELTSISYKLRDSFIEWTSSLGRDYWSNWKWWISPLANRNNQTMRLYVFICYIEILKLINKREKGSLLVVSDNIEFLEVVKDYFSQEINVVVPYSVKNALSKVAGKSFFGMKFAYTWCYFFYKSVTEWIVARRTRILGSGLRSLVSEPKHVLIHTCIDDDCLGEGGRFKDRYYPGLADYFRNKGLPVSTLIWQHKITKTSKSDTLKWLRNNKESFLIPQDYYNPYDSWCSFKSVMKSSLMPLRDKCLFRDVNFFKVVKLEQMKQLLNADAAYFINYIAMFYNMKQQGIIIDKYIDTWELKVCEIPPIIGIRKNYPQCKIIAYQHSALLPRLIFSNYKTTQDEFRAAPRPDIGIANSKITARCLADDGFPQDFIRLGPSLRFMYLNDVMTTEQQEVTQKGILVCLPLNISSACNMLEIIHNSLAEVSLPVRVKPHPMSDMNNIKKALSFDFPSKYEVVSGRMSDWFKRSDTVISSDSSTAVESVYQGIKTIVIGKAHSIDIVPLDILDNSAYWIIVCTEQEFQSTLRLMISSDEPLKNSNDFFEFNMDLLDCII